MAGGGTGWLGSRQEGMSSGNRRQNEDVPSREGGLEVTQGVELLVKTRCLQCLAGLDLQEPSG